MAAEAEEDITVVAGVEDVEDLDRIRDLLGGEFEPGVSTKQGSTAGSEMTLPFLFISIVNLRSILRSDCR